jgi:N6-adenosine-specific RNA methylase IME4
VSELTPSLATLAVLEERIQRGLQTFIVVGLALMEIRERRLYRQAGFTEFDDYCRNRWGWSEAHATRHIQAAEVAKALPIGNGPANEAQARELVPLAREDETQVLEVLTELRAEHGEAVTAALIHQAVGKRLRRKRKLEQIASLGKQDPPGLPAGRYRTLVADPPWRYDAFATKASANLQYPTMYPEEVAGLEVATLAEDDAHLWLWTTNALMEEAHRVVRAWGFKPATILTWCKPGPGVGNYLRNNTEHAILATRGQPLTPRDKPLSSWYEWSRARHSEKPEAFYALVEQVSPGPYLELFARRPRENWSCWGNEVAVGAAVAVEP